MLTRRVRLYGLGMKMNQIEITEQSQGLRQTRLRAFTIMEVLVVVGIIGVLIAILLPAAEKVRHQAYIDKCASNLRQIGLAIQMYEQDNHGNFPRTLASTDYITNPLTAGTGTTAADSFQTGPGSVQTNDLTAGLFMLMRVEKLPPSTLICPYNDDTEFVADLPSLTGRSNFTDQKKNLAYSFANPFPNQAAELAGYRLSNKLSADFALGADRNPGNNGKNDDVNAPALNSPTSVMVKGNSSNHEKDGQNVLYGDGHVAWQKTPFAGVKQDNIYNARNKPAAVESSPIDAADSVLLPTDD